MIAKVRWWPLTLLGVAALGALGAILVFKYSGDRPGSNPPKGNFRDVAAEAGLDFRTNDLGTNLKINLYDHSCGLAVADFDGDGFEDIYFVNPLGANALYKNRGDGTFVDVTASAGVAVGDRICVGATFGDYDNDGFPDLYVTSIRGGNILFRNLGNGTFRDVTKQAGVSLVGHSQSATFFDYDNDGQLDLFVTNMAKWTTAEAAPGGRTFPGVDSFFDLFAAPKEYSVLYRNNGNGTFTDVTAKAGVKGPGWGGDVAIFDFDMDGWQDLFVTNMFGRNQLLRNRGDGTFVDVTRAALGRTSFGAIGCKVLDYNNDGKLDLLVVDMHSDMWTTYVSAPVSFEQNEKKKFSKVTGPTELAVYEGFAGDELEQKIADMLQIRYDEVLFGNTLFKNLGNGKFVEVSAEASVETFWPWGIAVGDFNNDGFEDIFLPSGMGSNYPYWPNRLLMNNGDGTFSERSREEGIEPPRSGIYIDGKTKRYTRSSRCAAVADFRKVGNLDIVTNNFNDHPYFFQNHFPAKNYIAFELRGTKSNRDALGALVWLHVGKEVMVRQVQGGGGYLSQSSRHVHFGLGNRTRIDRVEIRWPSGLRQEIASPAINQRHRIVEPS